MPADGWPALKEELLPAGPALLRLCRYGPLRALRLVRATLVRSWSLVRRLEREFDQLPQLPEHFALYCEDETGAEIILYATYYRQHQAAVAVALTGCLRVVNVDIKRSAFGVPEFDPRQTGPQLVAELMRLTPN